MRKTVDLVNKPAGRRHERVPDDVLEAIHGVMHLYRSQQFRALRDAEAEVTHMESKVLAFFARHPGTTQSELVAHSGRDKGQLARLVGGLKERGLLQAEPDAQDRRSLRLSLTQAGRGTHDALRRQARRLAGVAVKGFSEEEKAALMALLARVRANLEGVQE